MSDIRKRRGKKGLTYQVRYADKTSESGYGYATFDTRKEALAFREDSRGRKAMPTRAGKSLSVTAAADQWLDICEKEGINGSDPVSQYTYENYEYRIGFIKAYDWPSALPDLASPDVVEFRSWLLNEGVSRAVASKVLSTLHSVVKEMNLRGKLSHNPAIGVSVRADSRYQTPVSIPTEREIDALLSAADTLANSKNKLTARTWLRYRPILYLAVDSGMRPQEYLAISRSALREKGVYVDRAIEGGGSEITVTKTPAGRRFIDLSHETLDMVRHYAANHAAKNDHDLVFPTSNGAWLSRRNWQRHGFNAACEAAGLVETVEIDGKPVEQVKYRPYDLRHFFASMLIEKRTNLKKIQTLMGHTNIETTLNVYGHLLEDAERDNSSSTGMLSGINRKFCGKSVVQVS